MQQQSLPSIMQDSCRGYLLSFFLLEHIEIFLRRPSQLWGLGIPIMQKKFLLGVAISLALLIIGMVILAFFCAPMEKSQVTYDESKTVKANECGFKDFLYYSAWDNIVSFSVSNGTIKFCEPLTTALLLEWEAGKYEPDWIEANHGSYEYRKANLPPGMIGPVFVRIFLFLNPDAYDKVVQIKVTGYWNEPNTSNLMSGATLIVIGSGTGLLLAIIYVIMYKRKAGLPSHDIPKPRFPEVLRR